jgi:DUF4097 and DUF4098 domain-containing protein YvlB
MFCLVALAIAPAFSATAEGKFTRTLQVSGAVDLDVRTGAGNITVHTGAPGSVQVTGTVRASDDDGGQPNAQERVRQIEANPPIEQNGSVIRIGHNPDGDHPRNISISYDVIVPADTRLRSQNGSGGQTIEGIRGPVDVATGSGNLEISRVSGEVKARSGSGHIRAEGVQGGLQAHAGSGAITGRDIAGPVSVMAGSGNITLERRSGANAGASPRAGGSTLVPQAGAVNTDVQTGSGNVDVSGVQGQLRARSGSGSIRVDGNPTAEWSLNTSSGSIRLRLPPQAAFDFRGHTSSGRISMNHPLTVQGTVGPRGIEGKVGKGGPLVNARTASGSIEVQ